MKAKSIQGKSVVEIKNKLVGLLSDDFNPTLAFVFISLSDVTEKVTDLLDKNGIAVFGATTYCGFTEEGTDKEGIAILLLDINPGYFKIVLKETGIPKNWSEEVAEIGLNTFYNPAYIISPASIKTPGEDIINGLTEKLTKEAFIVGGIAGEHITYSSTVFTNNKTSDYGLLALILDQDKIDLNGVAVSGWKPIGTEKTVTKSDGQWILTIDNQPAINVVKKYIGDEIVERNSTESTTALDTAYPLQVRRAGGSPLFVAIPAYNPENGAVLCVSSMPEGTTFRFSLPPDFEIVDTVVDSAEKIKDSDLPDADALIVFSCISRNLILGPMASLEVEGLANTWNIPMVGFFSMGEFGKVKDGNKPEFHGGTCSWVALKEKTEDGSQKSEV